MSLASTRDIRADDWLEDEEGQLALDVYQTDDQIVLTAPIAGVTPADLKVTITDDVISIEGQRHAHDSVEQANYFTQECYWGTFSRTVVLPTPVNADQAEADLKHGVLTIRVPKLASSRARSVVVTERDEPDRGDGHDARFGDR